MVNEAASYFQFAHYGVSNLSNALWADGIEILGNRRPFQEHLGNASKELVNVIVTKS